MIIRLCYSNEKEAWRLHNTRFHQLFHVRNHKEKPIDIHNWKIGIQRGWFSHVLTEEEGKFLNYPTHYYVTRFLTIFLLADMSFEISFKYTFLICLMMSGWLMAEQKAMKQLVFQFLLVVNGWRRQMENPLKDSHEFSLSRGEKLNLT